jgi:hypothetical protein
MSAWTSSSTTIGPVVLSLSSLSSQEDRSGVDAGGIQRHAVRMPNLAVSGVESYRPPVTTSSSCYSRRHLAAPCRSADSASERLGGDDRARAEHSQDEGERRRAPCVASLEAGACVIADHLATAIATANDFELLPPALVLLVGLAPRDVEGRAPSRMCSTSRATSTTRRSAPANPDRRGCDRPFLRGCGRGCAGRGVPECRWSRALLSARGPELAAHAREHAIYVRAGCRGGVATLGVHEPDRGSSPADRRGVQARGGKGGEVGTGGFRRGGQRGDAGVAAPDLEVSEI